MRGETYFAGEDDRILIFRLTDRTGVLAKVVARRRREGERLKGLADGSTQLNEIFVNVEEFHECIENEEKRGEDEFLLFVGQEKVHSKTNGQQTDVELREMLE